MILNPFWEWQPVQFFKELFRRCHEICFQNHPRGSFLKLYKSCQVSICSMTPKLHIQNRTLGEHMSYNIALKNFG